MLVCGVGTEELRIAELIRLHYEGTNELTVHLPSQQ